MNNLTDVYNVYIYYRSCESGDSWKNANYTSESEDLLGIRYDKVTGKKNNNN